jgi:hypothetical protein
MTREQRIYVCGRARRVDWHPSQHVPVLGQRRPTPGATEPQVGSATGVETVQRACVAGRAGIGVGVVDIPEKVQSRLLAGWVAEHINWLRALADALRDEALDHWADEADALADLWVAWRQMPIELSTDEGDTATSSELGRRFSALMRAVFDA